MNDTLCSLKIPACPQYPAGPVTARRLQLRAKGIDGAMLFDDVPMDASERNVLLPHGARCFIELVNVVHAAGSVEQDRLDFVAGTGAGHPPGLQVSEGLTYAPISPLPPAEPEEPPASPTPVAAEAASDEETDPPGDQPTTTDQAPDAPPADPPA